jgi:stage V sporulation protein G
MQITDVSVVPVDESKLRAYVNITIDDCFMIRGLKVIRGNKGLFVAMPNKKGRNGLFRDVAHPVNAETRKLIEDKVLEKYYELVGHLPEDEAGYGEDEQDSPRTALG